MNSKAFFGGVVVSPEADMVARELIHELHIPKLHNLAFLLEINKCFDDHQALRLWLQRMLDEGQAHYDDLAQQARLRLNESRSLIKQTQTEGHPIDDLSPSIPIKR